MRSVRLLFVAVLLAFVISVVVVSIAGAKAPRGLGVPTDLPRATAFSLTVGTLAQDPAAVEASLGFDRPTRRLIQQGLRNEGFDPGAPDGLFGPRTRAAIRRWQAARGESPTGYLNGAEAELLRVVGALPPPLSEAAAPPVPPPAGAQVVVGDATLQSNVDGAASVSLLPAEASAADPASAALNCQDWNTEGFFEMAPAATVTACLAGGAGVEARNDRSLTPLHWAAGRSTDPAVIEALLTAGADLEARTDLGSTPLHYCAGYCDSVAVLEALLGAGADIQARSDSGVTPLHEEATGSQNPAVVAALLTAGAELEARSNSGFTALNMAARFNANSAILEALLAAGADVNAQDDNDNTPLHLAAIYSENPAVVDALLAGGADVNAGYGGTTPLHLAASYNNTAAIIGALVAAGADLAAKNGNNQTPLHLAARYSDAPAVVEALVAAGADVAARHISFGTPLHISAGSNQNPAVSEALIAAGADVGARRLNRDTPLHRAVIGNNPAVIDTLLAAGADVSARSIWGYTPLHQAAFSSDPAVIRALLAARANVAARDDDGYTPLHYAARGRSSTVAEVTAILVAAGANPEARTTSGMTPLHSAAITFDAASAIESLLAADANLEARDADGNTPLHLASAWIHPDYQRRGSDWWSQSQYRDFEPHAGLAIEALLEAGANPAIRNVDGQTPWDLAEENEALNGTDAYWRLNDARFAAPQRESRRGDTRPSLPQVGGLQQSGRQGPRCEIPGYPNPLNVESLGLNWCGASVSLQRRAIALQAAGAWCAIAEGTSSSPEQVSARHQDINAACDGLDALGALGGPPCQCPTGYRP